MSDKDQQGGNYNDEGVLELGVFMEEDKFYIRSILNNYPLFEVEGNYEDDHVKEFIDSIDKKTLSDEILQLFEGIDIVIESTGVVCAVYDRRNGKEERYKVQLTKRDLKQSVLINALTTAEPIHNIGNVNANTVY